MAAHPRPSATPQRSLADAAPGDRVEVVYVLFGSLRDRYEVAGIRVGTRLRVRERDHDRLLVELPGGGLAPVDAVHAPFVEVRPLPEDAPRSPAPHLAAHRSPDRRACPEPPTPNPNTA